jgi:ATP-dependent HslUV protease subunit HslV
LNSQFHGTTILSVRHKGQIAMCGDGQVTLGSTIIKATARKVRVIANDKAKVLVGFAGATADAFAILDLFERQLSRYPVNLTKTCVELAKEWRLERRYRRLEAVLLACDAKTSLMVSGSGDVLEPDDNLLATVSGGPYALAAARALIRRAPELTAPAIAEESLKIASELCLYTNDRLTMEVLDSD